LNWDGIFNKKISCQNVINIISPLFSQNMKNNPWYKQYSTIFEPSNEFNNMCILSLNVVDEIIKKHKISNNGFQSMHVTDEKIIYHFHFICILIHNIT